MGQRKTFLGIILYPLQRCMYIVKHTPLKSDSLQPVVMVSKCYTTTCINFSCTVYVWNVGAASVQHGCKCYKRGLSMPCQILFSTNPGT